MVVAFVAYLSEVNCLFAFDRVLGVVRCLRTWVKVPLGWGSIDLDLGALVAFVMDWNSFVVMLAVALVFDLVVDQGVGPFG